MNLLRTGCSQFTERAQDFANYCTTTSNTALDRGALVMQKVAAAVIFVAMGILGAGMIAAVGIFATLMLSTVVAVSSLRQAGKTLFSSETPPKKEESTSSTVPNVSPCVINTEDATDPSIVIVNDQGQEEEKLSAISEKDNIRELFQTLEHVFRLAKNLLK